MTLDATITLPKHMRGLKKTEQGTVIPAFVSNRDGKPDFRIMDPEAFRRCCTFNLCWICGKNMGRFCTFVGGPLVAAQEVASEPPSHRECAIFAAQVCPYLAQGMELRRDAMPAHSETDFVSVAENPGITALCTSHGYRFLGDSSGSILLKFEHSEVVWYKQGKPATAEEVRQASSLAMQRYRLSPGVDTPAGRVQAAALEARLEKLAASMAVAA